MGVLNRLDNLVQITRRAVRELATQAAKKLTWGYGSYKTQQDKEVVEYMHAVEKLRNQRNIGDICISEKELGNIESKVYKTTGRICPEYAFDFTKSPNPDRVKWLLKNPGCMSREEYAVFAAQQCKKVDIDFKVVKKRCEEVGVNVKVTDVVICDAITLAIDIEEKLCDIKFTPKVTLHDCLVEFQTKVVPTNCDIDFKTYVTERTCGVSLDTILTERKCTSGLSVSVGPAKHCPASSSMSPSISPSASLSPSASASPSSSESTSASSSMSPSPSPACEFFAGEGTIPGCADFPDATCVLPSDLNPNLVAPYGSPDITVCCSGEIFTISEKAWLYGEADYIVAGAIYPEPGFYQLQVDINPVTAEDRAMYLFGCEDTYASNLLACSGDPGCIAVVTEQYNTCVVVHSSVPSGECVGTYSASIITDLIPTGFDGLVACGEAPILYYRDVQITFNDSLGNTAQFPGRVFTMLC